MFILYYVARNSYKKLFFNRIQIGGQEWLRLNFEVQNHYSLNSVESILRVVCLSRTAAEKLTLRVTRILVRAAW